MLTLQTDVAIWVKGHGKVLNATHFTLDVSAVTNRRAIPAWSYMLIKAETSFLASSQFQAYLSWGSPVLIHLSPNWALGS